MALTGYSLNYNAVTLDIVHPNVIGRDHIYSEDGSTYFYTRWVFDGIFVYNPQAVSFDATGSDSPGTLPTRTDVNIRERLRAQRKQLIWMFGADTLITTPLNGFDTDAKNGPNVERCNIIRTIGIKTFLVDLRIVCHINECLTSINDTIPNGPNQPVSPLLSHRWRRTETQDDDYFSAIITEGTCVFRSDVLRAMTPGTNGAISGWNAFPDQFRKDLFHPIPPYFKRGPIEVMPHEDGVTYSYRFTDKQRAFRQKPFDMTRIEAYHTAWYSQAGLAGAAVSVPRFNPTIFGISLLGPLNPMRLLPDIGGLVQARTPTYRQHSLVRVWGNGRTSRFVLMKEAIAVVLGCIGGLNTLLSREFFVSHELSGKFVQVEVTQETGAEEALVNAVVNVASNIGLDFGVHGVSWVPTRFAPVANNNETVTFTLSDGSVRLPIIGLNDGTNLGVCPPPPGDFKSRSIWLGNLVSQALSGPCQQPPKAPEVFNNPPIQPDLGRVVATANEVDERSLYGP